MTRSSLSFRTLSEERSRDPKPLSNRARDGCHEIWLVRPCRRNLIQLYLDRLEKEAKQANIPFNDIHTDLNPCCSILECRTPPRPIWCSQVRDGWWCDGWKEERQGLQYGYCTTPKPHSGAPDHPTHKIYRVVRNEAVPKSLYT